jgi:hypothetical protein
VGGACGQASGHLGIVVELKDGAAAPDEDPRWPAMRSTPTTAKPDGARHWLAVVTCGGRRGERQQLEHMAWVWQLTTWTRRSAAVAGDNRRCSDWPDRNSRAFKGTWLRQVQLVCGVDMPHALRQAGPAPASVPLTDGPPG